jgi:formylglycine-generating enzyme
MVTTRKYSSIIVTIGWASLTGGMMLACYPSSQPSLRATTSRPGAPKKVAVAKVMGSASASVSAPAVASAPLVPTLRPRKVRVPKAQAFACPAKMVAIEGSSMLASAIPEHIVGADYKIWPKQKVTVREFCLDETEVTVADYAKCVDAKKCPEPFAGKGSEFEASYNWKQPGKEAHPVNGVSWYDAMDYCRFAKKRLPKAIEWVQAYGGFDSTLIDEKKKDHFHNYCVHTQEKSGDKVTERHGTCPVGAFPESDTKQGAQDMVGNVWEWTLDRYQEAGNYASFKVCDRLSSCVVVGEGWFSELKAPRETLHSGHPAGARDSRIGFRCAL